MASIINASTAGVGGVITTADNSGVLNIQSGGTTVAAVTSTGVALTGTLSTTGNVTLGDASTDTLNVGNGGLIKDASGNVGIGVTPSAWRSDFKAIQMPNGASFVGYAGGTDDVSTYSISNAYYSSTGWKYIGNDYASMYQQYDGAHSWHKAALGTAGNTITFTQAMTLDASGNLNVGTTGVNTNAIQQNTNAATSTLQVIAAQSTTGNQYGIFVSLNGDPNNTTNYFMANRGAGSTDRCTIRSNGGIANYSANNVNISDRREKTNFAPAGNYLDKICAIPVQTFNYNDQNLEEDDGLTLGVVAQDVQAVCPEMVMESNWAGEDEPEKLRLSVYQTDLQYALMKSIQELKAIVDTQAEQIKALQGAK